MKKFISFLFSLLVIAALVCAAYTQTPFIKRQIDKVRGMYYVHKGDKAYKDMKLNKAIRYYNLGVRYFPGHYGAWYNLGNIYVAYEDYYSALNAYEEAFKHNPKMMIARMNYGVVATEKLGNFDEALKQYDEIINTERKMISIPYVFNNKFSSKENKAIAYYNKGVTYRMKSLYENADWELQRKYLAQAINAYEKSLEISPKRYDTLYNLGLAYHISGDYMKAGQNYCKAIEADPMNYEAHFNLAILLRRLRHFEESQDEIEKAATLIIALDENAAFVQYVAMMMNDISQSLQHDEEYKEYIKILRKKEAAEKQKDNEQKNEKEVRVVALANGKIAATAEIDKTTLESFGVCPSKRYFDPPEDDEDF